MSRWRVLTALAAGCLLLLGFVGSASSQESQRLMVENRTGSSVDVQVWRHNGNVWEWTFVITVPAQHGVPISGVHQSERFRARSQSGGEYRYHTVELGGGPEDRWRIE
jgi:hypothetical protein